MRYLHIQAMLAATTLSITITCPVYAQNTADFPSKPVRIVVAAGPGGGTDIQARMYAQKLSDNMKRSFVIDNRPGGGGTTAYSYVAQSAPDGYTLLAAAAAFTFAPALYPNLPVDPVKNFTPVSLINKSASMLVVHPSLPVKTIKELIALAKGHPATLNMAATFGGSNHLFAAYFISAADIKVTIIPYKGGNQDAADIMSGQVHMLMGNLSAYLPHVKSGRLRALAVTTAQRTGALPQVPTMSESGLRGFEASSWHGWLAPAGTPAAIVGKLSEELAKAVKSPDIVKKLVDDGAEPVGSTPEQFRQLISEEIPRWHKVVKQSGIRIE